MESITQFRFFKQCGDFFNAVLCCSTQAFRYRADIFPGRSETIPLRDNAVIIARHKGERPVYQITQVPDQLAVYALLKILPCKQGIVLFGAVIEDIETPHIRRNPRILCIGAEHADSLRFGKLAGLIVEVLAA